MVFKRPMYDWVKSFLKKPSVFVNSCVFTTCNSFEFRSTMKFIENINAGVLKTRMLLELKLISMRLR